MMQVIKGHQPTMYKFLWNPNNMLYHVHGSGNESGVEAFSKALAEEPVPDNFDLAKD